MMARKNAIVMYLTHNKGKVVAKIFIRNVQNKTDK